MKVINVGIHMQNAFCALSILSYKTVNDYTKQVAELLHIHITSPDRLVALDNHGS